MAARSRAPALDALRAAAVRASLAPSAFRSEPWRLVLRERSLEVHADRTRQLQALDPAGRQLAISCGSAVLNARAVLAAADWPVLVERHPEPAEPDLLARLTVVDGRDPEAALAHLVSGVDDARSAAPPALSDEVLLPASVATLHAATAAHAVRLQLVTEPDELRLAGRLIRLALLEQESDPARQAELRASRTLRPDVDGPLHGQVLALLTTSGDASIDWLRTGEALQHLVLEARRTFGVRPLPHVIENPRIRTEIRDGLGLDSHPQVVLQLGPPPLVVPSRHRRLVDVLSVAHRGH